MSNKKHTIDSIQQLSNEKHNNNFVIIDGQTYINNKSSLKFFCKTCNNIIYQNVNNHLSGSRCKICAHNDKFLTIDQIRIKVEDIFNYKYYIPDQEIRGVKYKISVFCKKCDDNFNVRLNGLLSGHGCKNCKYDNLRLDIGEVITKSKQIHFDKFYIPLQEVMNGDTRIKIFCKACSEYFYSSVSNHLQGYGCKKCSIKNRRYNLEEIRKISNDMNGDRYIIEEISYPKIKIFCKKCHNYFNQNIKDHVGGCGCPRCNFSRGEIEVEMWLEKNNIEYIIQKRFKDCRDKLPLPFDFYLPKLDICIEYDGEQHSKIKSIWGGADGYRILKMHDQIKTNYCFENNIELIRIDHDEDISEKLKQINNI